MTMSSTTVPPEPTEPSREVVRDGLGNILYVVEEGAVLTYEPPEDGEVLETYTDTSGEEFYLVDPEPEPEPEPDPAESGEDTPEPSPPAEEPPEEEPQTEPSDETDESADDEATDEDGAGDGDSGPGPTPSSPTALPTVSDILAAIGWTNLISSTPAPADTTFTNPIEGTDKYLGAFRFRVRIDGISETIHQTFTRASGIVCRSETLDYMQGTDPYIGCVPGRSSFEDVQLERVYNGSDAFYQWRKRIEAGADEYHDVTVEMFGPDRVEPVRTLTCTRCWPKQWELPEMDANASGAAIERIHLAVTEVTEI